METRYIKKPIVYYLNPIKIVKWIFFNKIYKQYIGFYNHKFFSKHKIFISENVEYKYFIHQHNSTYFNERCIEIPLIMDYFKKYDDKEILEVGNVLSHYFNSNHVIIDKFEKGAKVRNIDAIDFKGETKFKFICSISTIEHIGWDDYPKDATKIVKAIENLKSNLQKDGLLVATAPLGYNPNLDALIKNNEIGFDKYLFFRRINKEGLWEQVNSPFEQEIKYDSPFPCANVLFVGIYKKN